MSETGPSPEEMGLKPEDKLSDEQKGKTIDSLKNYLNGGSEPINNLNKLSGKEMTFLSELRTKIIESKKQNPNQEIKIDFSKSEPWKREMFNNIVSKLSESYNVVSLKQNISPKSAQPNQLSTTQQIRGVFEGIGEGAKQGAIEKIGEYTQRIRAVKNGQPLKPNDRLGDLMKDFKLTSGREWSDDFDFEEYKKNR